MAQEPNHTRLIPAKAAWTALGIGKTTFYGLVKARQLKLLKIGSRSLVHVDDLEVFVNSIRTKELNMNDKN